MAREGEPFVNKWHFGKTFWLKSPPSSCLHSKLLSSWASCTCKPLPHKENIFCLQNVIQVGRIYKLKQQNSFIVGLIVSTLGFCWSSYVMKITPQDTNSGTENWNLKSCLQSQTSLCFRTIMKNQGQFGGHNLILSRDIATSYSTSY